MALSRLARDSAMASASRSHLEVREFAKDEKGVPIPSGGVFWSVSHKENRVAGVVAKSPVGIDIEKIKPVSDRLIKRVVKPKESSLFRHTDPYAVFFKVFTAKEAVLKHTGIGLKGLSSIEVVGAPDENNLILMCSEQKYWVENYWFDGYLAAVTKNNTDINWITE